MKQNSTSLFWRTIANRLTWASLCLALCLGIQVNAQQASLPCNATVSTAFDIGPNGPFSGLSQTSDAAGLGSILFPGNVIDGNSANFATASFVSIPTITTGSASLTVADNDTYNGGNFAGFLIQSNLINVNALGAITVRTYLNSTLVETSTSANLIGVSSSLLSGAFEIGFYTTQPFNKISITLTNAGGLGSYDIYYAVMRGYCATNTPLACNTPTTLSGPAFPAIVNPVNTGFGGLLSVGTISNPDNAISPSTTDAASLAITAAALGTGSFSIKLQNQVFNSTTNALDDGYPAGTFAGIDFSNPSVIELAVGSGIRIQTYYHGNPTTDIAASGDLFVAGNTSLLTGTGRRTLGLVTTTKFDEIKLTVTGTGANVGTVLIYGAVVKRLCAATIACNTTSPLSNTAFPTVIDPARTGLRGVLGVAFTIQDQDNVISPSTTDFAIITNTAAVATTASIGVLDPVDTYPPGTFAGFTIERTSGLVSANLFNRLTITTYNNGTFVESRTAGNLLDLSVALFGASSGFINAGFVATQPFDEIQISVTDVVGLGVLGNQLRVYGAFIDTRNSLGNGLVCALNTNPDFAVTNKNVPVSGNVNTNDVVPAGTTYGAPTLTSSPGGSSQTLTLTPAGSYTFTGNTPGVYVYTVPVCVSAICVSQTLTVTVLDPTVNTNKPVANPDIASTTGASTNPASVSVNVRANDGPGNPGGTLGIPTIATNPANGSATVNGSGNVIYTPNPGFFGTDVLTYQVCETPGNLCSTATVTITVKAPGSNNTTTAADDYISTYEGAAVTGNVKTNDSDPEGNTQTVTAQNTTIPGKGTLVLAADGSYTFTPVAGATGPVDFSYTTTDNGTPAASANGTLHVLINPFNPNPDFNVTDKGVPVTGSVKTNDVVPVGTTYGTPIVTSSPGGSTPTLTLTPTGSYTFTSTTPGVYTYSVPVCTIGTPPVCTTETLTITVLDPTVNTNNPVANPDFATTTGSPTSPTAVTINVRANDGAGNIGGTLGTPTIPAQPAQGTASIVGGNLVYTPNPGFFGTDVVTYQVCETPSTPSCATATVTITVVAPTAPGSPATVSANDDYVFTLPGVPASGNVLTNDLGTGLTVSNPTTTVTPSGTLVVTVTGSYTFTPAPGATGPVDFTYTTCDTNTPSNCASATLHVLIDQIPDLTPTILIDNLNFTAGSVGSPRDFIVNISEVNKVPTSGTVTFKIAKLSAFAITYSPTSVSANVFGGVPVSNTQWTFSEDANYITVQTNVVFAAFSNKLVGFSIDRKVGIPVSTVQNINVTISPNAGGEQNFLNNIAVTSVVTN